MAEERYRVVYEPQLDGPRIKLTIRITEERGLVTISTSGWTQTAALDDGVALVLLERMESIEPLTIPIELPPRPFEFLDGSTLRCSYSGEAGQYHAFSVPLPDATYWPRHFAFCEAIIEAATTALNDLESVELLGMVDGGLLRATW